MGAAIEEAARRYSEIIMVGGEPPAPPEDVFREVAGRPPNQTETAEIKERIAQLTKGWRG